MAQDETDAAAFKLTDLLWSHQAWAFNGTHTACSCDHRFRTQSEHREHLAAALLPGVRELGDLRAAEELEAAGDAHPCTRGRLHERAAALRGEAGR